MKSHDALTINVEFVNSLKMYDLRPVELTRNLYRYSYLQNLELSQSGAILKPNDLMAFGLLS